jgi:ATP-binding cassette subfamily F protein uup
LLEELLVDYTGTLLIVSHDRAFLNNVVTSTLVFEGEGVVKEYAGGYDDWVRARSAANVIAPPPAAKVEPARVPRERPRKLSFKEQKELERLPGVIETLESEQTELQQKFAEPGFYQQSGAEIAKVTNRLESVHEELQSAYARWEELETLH